MGFGIIGTWRNRDFFKHIMLKSCFYILVAERHILALRLHLVERKGTIVLSVGLSGIHCCTVYTKMITKFPRE